MGLPTTGMTLLPQANSHKRIVPAAMFRLVQRSATRAHISKHRLQAEDKDALPLGLGVAQLVSPKGEREVVWFV